MKGRADVLGEKILEWKRLAESLERGGNPQIKKAKREAVDKIKPPEVNYGFGKNTVIIPFKRGAEEEVEGQMAAKKARTEAGSKEEGEVVVKKVGAEVGAEGSAQETTILPAERVRADSVDVAREMEKEKAEQPGSK